MNFIMPERGQNGDKGDNSRYPMEILTSASCAELSYKYPCCERTPVNSERGLNHRSRFDSYGLLA